MYQIEAMRTRFTRLLGSLALILLVWLSAAHAAQAHDDHEPRPPDYALPDGWYYTQTGGDTGHGYAILDYSGLAFWSGFQRLGGVPALGYPVSLRFNLDGFVYQATQKALLQWNPGTSSVVIANTFDMLSAAGSDDWLVVYRQIPKSFDWSADDPVNDWEGTVQNHLTRIFAPQPGDTPEMSAARAALKERFLSDPNWLQHAGLPLAVQDFGPMVVMRAQRVALQYWKVAMPWANVGDVTVVLGGDVAKESGLIPAAATAPGTITAALLNAMKPPGGALPPGGQPAPPPQTGAPQSLPVTRIAANSLADRLLVVGPPSVIASPHGNFRVYLRLRNDANAALTTAVEALLLAAGGAEIGHASGDVIALPPGATRAVRLLSSDPFATAAALELRFSGTLAVAETHASAISFSGVHYEREGNLHALHGSVTNNGARPYSLHLGGALLDAASGVLGMATGQVSNLLPGKTREFKLATDENVQGVVSHTVAANVIIPK